MLECRGKYFCNTDIHVAFLWKNIFPDKIPAPMYFSVPKNLDPSFLPRERTIYKLQDYQRAIIVQGDYKRNDGL
jgi:hypothetical protein